MKVIAIGSRLMKDDGVGIRVAQNLEGFLIKLGIEVLVGETDSQYCYYSLKANDFVVILDAMYTGSQPGDIGVFSLEEIIGQSQEPFLQHDRDLFELMRLNRSHLNGYLIGIEAEEIGFGTELSVTLEKKMTELCIKIKELTEQMAAGSFSLPDWKRNQTEKTGLGF